MPLDGNSIIGITSTAPAINGTIAYNASKCNTISQFLIISDGKNYQAYIITIVADFTWLSDDYTKLKKLNYRNKGVNFSGKVMYFSPNGRLLNGYKYQNGIVVGSISGGVPITSKQQIQELINTPKQKTLSESCAYQYEYVYQGTITITDGDGNIVSQTNHYMLYITQTCIEQSDQPIGVGDDGGFGSPGGGGSVITPIPVTFDIKNNVNDVCLHKMVDATINANITTVINGMIEKVFGGSAKVNIIYVDDPDLPSGVYGFAPPPSGLDANGNLSITVKLNKNTLPNCSQQFIATVIMHESLHAYLTTINYLGALQHETIANTFVTQMATDLRQMFPGLSEKDSKNLALCGLEATNEFKNTISNNLELDGQYGATLLAYTTGTKGKRCNDN